MRKQKLRVFYFSLFIASRITLDASRVQAVQPDLNVSTAKSTLLFSKGALENKNYALHHLSLEAEGKFKKTGWGMSAVGQVHLFSGNYLRFQEWKNFEFPLFRGASSLEWDSKVHQDQGSQILLRLHRFKLFKDIGPGELSSGRLRNGFGSSRVFLAPMDRLDDLPVVTDSLERPGSDTLAFRRPFGGSLDIRAAYLWARQDNRYRSYAHVSWLAREGLELQIMAGRLEPKTNAIGTAVQKSIAGGELRWEATQNRLEAEEAFLDSTGGFPVLSLRQMKKNFSRHLVFWEKTGTADWVTSVEYYHNGRGARDPARYDFSALLKGEDLHLGRDYLGLRLQKTLSPLWAIAGQGILSHTDDSYSIGPHLEFTSPNSKWTAHLKSAWNRGKADSEYGRLPDRFSLDLQFYF